MKNLSENLGGFNPMNQMQETHSCSCGDRYQNHPVRDPYSKTVFQCALKCEGDKTYNASGNCPVCNINLEQITELHQRYF